jgi:hypothetical protein
MSDKYAKYRIDQQELSPNVDRWEKYKVVPAQSNLELFAKSAANGVVSLADLPQTALSAVEWLQNNAQRVKSPIGEPVEESNFFSELPLASSKIKGALKDYAGLDIEPKPNGSSQRVLAHAGDFAGGGGIFGMFAKAKKLREMAKLAGGGAGVGAISGELQEEGMNPLIADLGTAVASPFAVAGGKNLLNKFSNSHKQSIAKGKVANALKDQIGDENLPAIIANIDNYKKQILPIDLQLTTAEIAQDPSLSKLYRTQSNSPALSSASAQNDAKLLAAIEGIGETGLPESVRGEAVRAPFVDKYDKVRAERSEVTKPLYDKLKALEEGINPITARELLAKELEVASPGNAAALKRYSTHLGEEGATLRPIQIENTIQELGDKVNAYARTGENNAARRYREIKDAYEADLATSPVGLNHREEYRKLSQPINEIETSSLLNNFVKKNKDVNKAEGFVVSSEKIPSLILNADLANTRLLVNKAKGDKELLDLVKGTYIDKLLETTRLASGNFSYDKANKFLNNKYNKEKLQVIFNGQERKKLDQFLDTLERRSKLDSMGKVSGSDTHQKLKVEEDLKQSLAGLGKMAGTAALNATGLGGIGSTLLNMGRNRINAASTGRYNAVLEDALVNPEYFSELMSQPQAVKSLKDFYNPNLPLYAPILKEMGEE